MPPLVSRISIQPIVSGCDFLSSVRTFDILHPRQKCSSIKMGIFSRKPHTPEPSISLILDEYCPGPFHPGSVISGTATLQSPVQRYLQLAQVSFFGHAMTHAYESEGSGKDSNSIYFRDDASLFRINQCLSQSTTIERHQISSWRLQFTFPHFASLVGPSPYTGKTA